MTVFAIVAPRAEFPEIMQSVAFKFSGEKYRLWPLEDHNHILLVSSKARDALAFRETVGLPPSSRASIFPILSAPFGPAPQDVYEWLGRNITFGIYDPE